MSKRDAFLLKLDNFYVMGENVVVGLVNVVWGLSDNDFAGADDVPVFGERK